MIVTKVSRGLGSGLGRSWAQVASQMLSLNGTPATPATPTTPTTPSTPVHTTGRHGKSHSASLHFHHLTAQINRSSNPTLLPTCLYRRTLISFGTFDLTFRYWNLSAFPSTKSQLAVLNDVLCVAPRSQAAFTVNVKLSSLDIHCTACQATLTVNSCYSFSWFLWWRCPAPCLIKVPVSSFH